MANEVIVFPDATATALDFLVGHASFPAEVEVGARLAPSEARQVVVTLVDSEIFNVAFQRSILHVECWVDDGPTSHEDAQDLAQLTRGILGAMAGTEQARGTVYRVVDEGAQGIADQPDLESGKFRYPFDIAITMRGSAV